ncbi:fibronectin type III domain-containing protein [Candidatus Nomurabacteria bacterium]|nr:fibronectin type III domain-containing protein [Candidatus Nomurabacteria bacterium]
MKTLNQRSKSIIVSSLLVFTFVFSPLGAFAKENKNSNGEYKAKAKVEQRAEVKKEKNSRWNSFWDRVVSGWSLGTRVRAQVQENAKANSMPNISGITAPTVLKTGQMGTWTVKASDPNNDPLSYSVDWGESSPSIFKMMTNDEVFVQTSTFTHAYLNPGTYTVKFTVRNSAELETVSTVNVHVVGESVKEKPVISDLTATPTAPHKATIKWTTNVRASTVLWYGTTSPTDTSGSPIFSRGMRSINHKINLTKLTPDTTYYVVVGSANGAGMTKSSEISFTTPSKTSEDAPVIVSLSGPKTIGEGETETVTVNAYDPENDSLSYSVDWGDNLTPTALRVLPNPVFVQSATFSHVYDEAGKYFAKFTVKNSKGLTASSTMEITVTEAPADTVPPVIESHDNITAKATSTAGAVVTYTSPKVTDNVDEDTTATCLPASGSTFPIGVTTVLCNHKDSSGNAAVQTSFTVTVTADVTPPVIVGNIGVILEATSATVSWVTDETSDSTVFYSTITPLDVDADTTSSVSSDLDVTAHSLNLSGLTANTLYHVIVKSSDASNNSVSSSEFTFTTNP